MDAILARQHAILDEHRPDVHLVIGQAALHQQAGCGAVMDAQLRHLAEAASDSGTVTVQVLPFEAGPAAAATEGSLGILQFTGTAGLGVVHLGGIAGGVCLEGRGDLVAYATAFDRLRAHAHTSAESAQLLGGLADR